MARSSQAVAGNNVKHAGAKKDGAEEDVGNIEHGFCPFDAGAAGNRSRQTSAGRRGSGLAAAKPIGVYYPCEIRHCDI